MVAEAVRLGVKVPTRMMATLGSGVAALVLVVMGSAEGLGGDQVVQDKRVPITSVYASPRIVGQMLDALEYLPIVYPFFAWCSLLGALIVVREYRLCKIDGQGSFPIGMLSLSRNPWNGRRSACKGLGRVLV